MRLDLYLVNEGICFSRTEAQRAVKEGRVQIGGNIVSRCAFDVTGDMTITLLDGGCPFVSRGGEKLHAALEHFHISVSGLIALDVGASTGGFTDCLLQNGAARVYALENGAGQLHPTLRDREDVISMEHTNARSMTKEMFPSQIDLATMDVSFISQKLILPALASVLDEGGILISLIKPQFEVGRSHVGKGGIVKDARARENAVCEVCSFADTVGFTLLGKMESPIKGGDGNTEYIAYFKKRGGNTSEL